jgi:hypothetical protein
VRLNTLISKYGASRELIHFKDVLETHLPYVTEFHGDEHLLKDINHTSHVFRGEIQKFLKNKRKAKETYKDGKKNEFLIHELVMRKIYNPASPLHPTFSGPYRIIEIHNQGALLKDPRTGEMLSVHFMNLRKLSIDEFITLLPNNFDADILQTLGMYRYNKNTYPDPPLFGPKEVVDEVYREQPYQPDNRQPENQRHPPNIPELNDEIENTRQSDHDHYDPVTNEPKTKLPTEYQQRRLRSGRIVNINVQSLPKPYENTSKYAYFSYVPPNIKKKKPVKSCLTRTFTTEKTPYADIDQYMDIDDDNVFYAYHSRFLTTPNPEPYHKTKYSSNFQSPLPGYLTIKMEADKESTAKAVKFDKIIVKFY